MGTLALPTLAAESAKERAIDYRQGLMEVFGWNLTALGAVIKGEAPYDKAVFERHARDLASAAQLDVLKGFPEDSVSDESDAKDEIWLQWPLFGDKYRALQEETDKLARVSASGDLEKIRPQFQETAAACKGCHKEFKK
jgi:cytochrome c556